MYGDFTGAVAAVALLCFFQLCGVCIAATFLNGESPSVRCLLGSVLGSVMLQWFPAVAAFPLGFTQAAHFIAVLLAAAVTACVLILGRKRGLLTTGSVKSVLQAPGAFLRNPSLWVAALLWLFFCFLALHSFRWEEGQVFSSQATFGDMPMHLSFITSLARQGTFPPNYSLLPGVRLSYPFLSDSISSSLYLLGAPLRLAYCLPMFVAGAQVLFGGWLFLRALAGNRRRGFLAWVLFFFNGGLGLIYFLEKGALSRILTEFYQTPTNLSEKNVRWVNVVVDMMLPQRATLFGWAVLFPALYLLYRAVFRGQEQLFPAVGLLAGALPMIHTHSFLALALVCGAWLTASLCERHGLASYAVRLGKTMIPVGLALMAGLKALLSFRGREDGNGLLVFACGAVLMWAGFLIALAVSEMLEGRGKPLLKTWGLLLGVTLVLALPQLVIWTFRQVSAGGMVRGHFGWVTGQDNYLWFYLKNLGLTAVLAVFGLLMAKGKAFVRYCPALAVWFVAEFVEFQPNDYDNNKLLYVGFLFLCCAAAEGLCRLLAPLRGRRARTAAAAVVVMAVSVPAVLTMGREAVASYELFGDGGIQMCQYIEERFPADAVILTDQRHNNEITSLSGRNVVCGSPAYLFYHGLPYGASEYAAKKLYEAPMENRALFWEMGVDYVLVSDFEQNSFEVDQEGLDKLFERVYDDGNRVLYQVSPMKNPKAPQ